VDDGIRFMVSIVTVINTALKKGVILLLYLVEGLNVDYKND